MDNLVQKFIYSLTSWFGTRDGEHNARTKECSQYLLVEGTALFDEDFVHVPRADHEPLEDSLRSGYTDVAVNCFTIY